MSTFRGCLALIKNVSTLCCFKYAFRSQPFPVSTSYSPCRLSSVALVRCTRLKHTHGKRRKKKGKITQKIPQTNKQELSHISVVKTQVFSILTAHFTASYGLSRSNNRILFDSTVDYVILLCQIGHSQLAQLEWLIICQVRLVNVIQCLLF